MRDSTQASKPEVAGRPTPPQFSVSIPPKPAVAAERDSWRHFKDRSLATKQWQQRQSVQQQRQSQREKRQGNGAEAEMSLAWKQNPWKRQPSAGQTTPPERRVHPVVSDAAKKAAKRAATIAAINGVPDIHVVKWHEQACSA